MNNIRNLILETEDEKGQVGENQHEAIRYLGDKNIQKCASKYRAGQKE
jgi:hypothetical protein